MATDTIDSLREKHAKEIDDKMERLRPAHEEFLDLQEYRDSLMSGGRRARTAARSTGTRRRSSSASGQPDRRGQFLAALVKLGGSPTIPQVSEEIGDVGKNYLYRVRDGLVDDGLIVADGGGFKLTEKGMAEAGAQPAAA